MHACMHVCADISEPPIHPTHLPPDPVGVTKNQINLELIKKIQFCLKIYDLQRQPNL